MELSQVCSETLNLLNEHGLLSKGWVFKLGRGKRRLGACNYKTKTVSVSRFHIMIHDDAEVRDTIRHEVAHALAGPGAGHGPIWKRYAVQLGAKPHSRAHTTKPIQYRYELHCGFCGMLMQRRYNRIKMRRLQNMWHVRCGSMSMGHLFFKEIERIAV